MKKCSFKECQLDAGGPLVDAKPHCPEHAKLVLTSRMRTAYESWVEGDEVSCQRFAKTLGRLSSDTRWFLINSDCLSYARIRDRAWNFSKTPRGCRFMITRHPGSHRDGFVSKKVVQTWEADFDTETITLTGSRDWNEGDPDPGYSIQPAD